MLFRSGEPKVQKSNEWRWNNKGSLTLNLEAGTFYDFEQGQGGGVKWLIEQHGQDVTDGSEERRVGKECRTRWTPEQ